MSPDTPAPATRERQPRKWLAPCAVLGCAIFLYMEAFALPFTPWAAIGDQAIYLYDAGRMLDGQTIYRDFDHFTLPGTSMLYLALFKIFGVWQWIPQAMLVLIGTLIAWLSFGICRKLLRGPSAFLPGFLFLMLPFSGFLDATHHWYSTLAVTAALAVLIEGRTPLRLAAAGALCGLGTCFAQSLVLSEIGLALYLVWERHRAKESRGLLLKKGGSLWGSFLVTVAGCNAYFVWKAGYRQFFYNTVVFVARYYPKGSFNSWPAYLHSRPPMQGWTNWTDLPAWPLAPALPRARTVGQSLGWLFMRDQRPGPPRPILFMK